MTAVVDFNDVRYSLDALRARAGSAPDVALNRNDVVLEGDRLPSGVLNAPLDQVLNTIEQKLQPAARFLIVCQYEGKYYFLQGLDKAIERFKESDTVKARLLSKVALKKAVLGYEGAKIVVEEPEPRYPRSEYRGTRDVVNRTPRSRYSTGS